MAWLGAFALLLVILAGAGVWLDRESTLQQAARWIGERTSQRLVLEDPHGSLLSRATFSRVTWRRDNRTVTFEEVGLRWSPWWLLAGIVAVDNATASRTVVDLPATEGPRTLPVSLEQSMRVRIVRAHTAELAIVRGGSPTTFHDVGFTAGAGWRDWYFKLAPATTPWGRLTAEGRIAHHAPFKLDARVELVREAAQPVTLRLAAKGPLERFDVDGALSAQASAIALHAIATPYAALPLEALDVKLQAFNPRDVMPSAPAAAFEGEMTLARQDDALHGTLKVRNASAGTLDAGRMPLSSVDAALTGRADGVEVAGLVADFGAAGRVQGKARVSGNQVALELRSDRLDLHGLHATMKPTALKAGVGVSGDLSAQDVRMNLAQKGYTLALAAQVTPDAIVVREARAAVGGGSARFTGRLGLDATHPYSVKATLARFDPSAFGLAQKANLNGTIDAEGTLTPAVRVRADITLAQSTWSGLPASGHARWRSLGVDDPRIAIDANARVGSTDMAARGRLEDPANLRSLDLRLELAGQDLAELYAIFRVPLASAGPYKLAGQLRHDGAVWSFDDFKGVVGRSDLAGSYSVDLGNARPMIKAVFVSERLDITDLSGFVGGGPAAQRQPGKVLPHSEYHLDRLRAADADVTFTGRRFRNEMLPLNRMNTHLVLRNGLLTLDPLEFGAAGGRLDGKVVLDARAPTITGDVDLRARDLDLSRLAPSVKALVQSTGKVDARVRLRGTGNSVAALLGSADGNVAAVMSGVQVSDLALRLANLDLANAIVAVAKGNQPIAVHCLVADFRAEHGVLLPDPLVLDTEHTLVTGTGRIALGDEALDLRLTAQPKDGSVLALRGPILVQGTMANPSVRPEMGSMLARTGAAVLLGIVATPAAAVLPFMEMGKPVEANCAQRVAEVRGFVANGTRAE